RPISGWPTRHLCRIENVILVSERVEDHAFIQGDVLAFDQKERRRSRPEQNGSTRGQNTRANSMASTISFVDRVAERYPLAVHCADAVDGKIQLARTAHVSLLLGFRDCSRYSGAVRDHDLIPDLHRFGDAQLDGLALVGGSGRD